MANSIIIFWKWFNPFSTTDEGTKQWDRKKKVALLKVAVICSLLIPVVIFYIKCNEVSVLFTDITSTNLYGNIQLNSKVSICYDFSRSKDVPMDLNPGIELRLDIPERVTTHRLKPVFAEESVAKFKSYKAADSFDRVSPCAEDVLSLYKLLTNSGLDGGMDIDSICSLYKIHIKQKAVFPLKPLFFDGTKEICRIDSCGRNGYLSSCTIGMPPITNNDTVKSDVYYLSDGHRYCSHTVHLYGTSFRYYRNILIDARDISRSVEVFRITGDMKMGELDFNFLGSTEFSAIYPNPDVISCNSIRYNDPEKLAVIAERGLVFHTKFPDMENKQQARMFATTTLLTLLITLLFKYLYVLTADFGRFIYENHPKWFKYCFLAMIALPVLYIIISLYFPIVI